MRSSWLALLALGCALSHERPFDASGLDVPFVRAPYTERHVFGCNPYDDGARPDATGWLAPPGTVPYPDEDAWMEFGFVDGSGGARVHVPADGSLFDTADVDIGRRLTSVRLRGLTRGWSYPVAVPARAVATLVDVEARCGEGWCTIVGRVSMLEPGPPPIGAVATAFVGEDFAHDWLRGPFSDGTTVRFELRVTDAEPVLIGLLHHGGTASCALVRDLP